MSQPCTSRRLKSHSSSNATVSERRVTSARLRQVGILISEIPSEHREEVRRWATTLTEIEIEMLAVTVRSLKSEDARIDSDLDVYEHDECCDDD